MEFIATLAFNGSLLLFNIYVLITKFKLHLNCTDPPSVCLNTLSVNYISQKKSTFWNTLAGLLGKAAQLNPSPLFKISVFFELSLLLAFVGLVSPY